MKFILCLILVAGVSALRSAPATSFKALRAEVKSTEFKYCLSNAKCDCDTGKKGVAAVAAQFDGFAHKTAPCGSLCAAYPPSADGKCCIGTCKGPVMPKNKKGDQCTATGVPCKRNACALLKPEPR